MARLHRLSSNRAVLIALGVLSVLGTLSLLVITRWDIGTSPDSIKYIRAARELSAPEPFTLEPALIHHAPFFSFLLAIGGAAGLDPLDGARWINSVVFGLNIFLV